MEINWFFYNIFSIIFFTLSLAFILILLLKYRNHLNMCFALLIGLFLIDTIILFTLMGFNTIATQYNLIFLTSPILKTLIIFPTLACYLYIGLRFVKCRFSFSNTLPLIIYLLLANAILLIPDQSLKTWVYYSLPQIYLVSLFLWLLYRIKLLNQPSNVTPLHQRVLYLLILFCCFIFIEDGFIIFNVDEYSLSSVNLFHRNISEDMMHFFTCLCILIFQFKKLNSVAEPTETLRCPSDDDSNSSFLTHEQFNHSQLITVSDSHEVTSSNPLETEAHDDDTFDLYCQTYHLSHREKEILHLLLNHYNNQAVSDHLFISLGTVKAHVHNIYQKIDVYKRNELLTHYLNYQENR